MAQMSKFLDKETWFAEAFAVIDGGGAATWFVRTDTGKELSMAVQEGRLVLLSCGFNDVRGTMGVLSRCERVAVNRSDPPSDKRRTVLAHDDLKDWLGKARRSEEIEVLPSERLSFGGKRPGLATAGTVAQPAKTMPPLTGPIPGRAAAQPPGGARAAATIRARGTEEVSAPAPSIGARRATQLPPMGGKSGTQGDEAPPSPSPARAPPPPPPPPPPPREPVPYLRRAVIAASLIATVGAIGYTSGIIPAETITLNIPGRPITVSSVIRENTRWREGATMRLEGRVVVEGTSTLTIEPGVRIEALPGAGLRVERDATLIARGTMDAPIVFTTADPGKSGQWAGLTLLGNAPVRATRRKLDAERTARGHGGYGGWDSTDACATMRYVRIEWAGGQTPAALELLGCGDRTWIEDVQVHSPKATAIAIRGGAVRLRRIVVSQAAASALDTSTGWMGSVQGFIAQMAPGSDKTPMVLGRDGEGNASDAPALLHNITIIGARRAGSPHAVRIEGRAPVHLVNTLIAGAEGPVIELTEQSAQQLNKERTRITHMVVSAGTVIPNDGQGPAQARNALLKWANDADNALARPAAGIFSAAAWSPTQPVFAPMEGGAVEHGGAAEEGLDPRMGYRGAVRPGAHTDWTWKWTAYGP